LAHWNPESVAMADAVQIIGQPRADGKSAPSIHTRKGVR
jgi:hypothetical protein